MAGNSNRKDLADKRLQEWKEQQDSLHEIWSSGDNNSDKTVDLLHFIASQLIDQNMKLDAIEDELFNHTLSLEEISDR